MRYSVDKLAGIDLGRQGENLARTVEIDVSALLNRWPGAVISLLVKRKHDAEPYVANAHVVDGVLYWPITAADTASAGDGKVELRAVCGEVLAKSATGSTRVTASLTGNETEPPDAAQGWVDKVIAAGGGAQASAEAAREAAAEAKASAESAEATGAEALKARDEAKTFATGIRTAAESADESAKSAAASASTAKESEINSKASEDAAALSAREAKDSEEQVKAAETSAQGSAERAETARQKAEEAAADAHTESESAKASEAAALNARNEAEAFATDARTSVEAAKSSAEAAASSASAAQASETNARASENAAAASEKNVRTAEANAKASADAALASQEKAEASEEAASEAAERAETAAQKAETATDEVRAGLLDDEQIAFTSAWSSRQTVEQICPEAEASGNPVQLPDLLGEYPLSVTAHWEPIQEGSGDPYPPGAGPNVLDLDNFVDSTVRGITFTRVGDGIKITGTAESVAPTSSLIQLPNLAPGTYYGWTLPTGITTQFVIKKAGAEGYTWQAVNNSRGVTIEEGDKSQYWYVNITAGATINATIYPQLVRLTTPPTQHYPYSNIRPITGRNGVKVNCSGGRAWRLITLDGTEEFVLKNYNGRICFEAAMDIETPYSPQNLAAGSQKCTHFALSNPYISDTDNAFWIYKTALMSTPRIRLYSSALPTAAEVKAYLSAQSAAGTPVQFAYRLAEMPLEADENGVYFAGEPAQRGTGDPSPTNIRPILTDNAAPYTPTQTIFFSETVYGGSVDTETGEGTESVIKLSLPFANMNNSDAYPGWAKIPRLSDYIGKDVNATIPELIVCSNLLGAAKYGCFAANTKGSLSTFMLLLPGMTQTEIKAAYSDLVLEVCLRVRNPIAFQATGGQPITALPGVNTLTTNADSLTVRGREDLRRTVASLRRRIAALESAAINE